QTDSPERDAAEERAQDLLDQMTLEEKVSLLHGVIPGEFPSYYTPGIERLGIPPLSMSDGPAGVGKGDPEANDGRWTQLPAPIALAASWNPDLAQQYGDLIGDEAHRSGINVMLASVLDALRVPQFGRVFEGFGEDPLL